MVQMVQLCIGRSTEGALLLYQKRPPSPPDPDASLAQVSQSESRSTQTASSYILKLPEELLHLCFQPVVQSTIEITTVRHYSDAPCVACSRHVMARRLTRVCRQFAAVARPLLYRDIDFSREGLGHCAREPKSHPGHAELFLRTISERPDLARWIRRLSVDFDFLTQLLLSRPETLSNLGKTLNDLTLGEWSATHMHEQWDSFVGALGSLGNLSALTLKGLQAEYRRLPKIAPLMEQLPALSKLCLWDVECPRLPRDEATNRPSVDHHDPLQQRFNDEAAALLLQSNARVSCLKELRLFDCSRISPVSLHDFLCWPRNLEHFTMDSIAFGDYGLEMLINMGSLTHAWTWQDLETALKPQRQSLRELRIGQIASQRGFDTFNLHKFPALHTFQTYWPLGAPTGEDAVALWLTPALTVLILDSAWNDSQEGKMFFFEKQQCDWLIAFAAGVARRRSAALDGGPTVSLQRIEILFELDATLWADDERRRDSLKWLAEIPQEVESYGIQLVLPDFSRHYGFG